MNDNPVPLDPGKPRPDADGKVRELRTTQLPRYEVRSVRHETAKDKIGLELTEMRQLAALDGPGLVGALSPLDRAPAQHADPQALQADRWREDRRYKGDAQPRWRPFQLAFVLMALASIADPTHDDRKVADLIYFPTGGGKTEAYLGLIAITLNLRRLRGKSRADEGRGVAVVLRYTLRLLTLDQLGRTATLVCALKEMRRRDPKRLGNARFGVGLWVGQSATANRLKDVHVALHDFTPGAPTRRSR